MGIWADFDPEDFRELIHERGEPVTWEKAFYCDCYSPEDNFFNENCQRNCEQGMVYVTQSAGPYLAWIDAVNKTINDARFGRVNSGEAKCMTMFDEMPLAHLDRITRLTARGLYSQRVQRSSGADALLHPNIQAVTAVHAAGGTDYLQGTDWSLSNTGVTWLLTWVPGRGPTVGSYYSVEYQYQPRWWFLGDRVQQVRPNNDGQLLVHRGVLTFKAPTAIR